MVNPKLLYIGGPDISLKIDLFLLLKEKYEIVVFGSNISDLAKLNASGINTQLYFLDRNFSLRSDIKTVYDLFNKIKLYKPDILQTSDSKPAIIGRLVAIFLGVPIIVGTLTGLLGFLYSENKKLNIKEKFIKFFYEKSLFFISKLGSQTVFQNTDDYKLFISKGIVRKKNSAIIPSSGLDTRKFSKQNINKKDYNKIKDEFGLSKNDFVITCITRLVVSKGVVQLINVARRLKKNNSNVKFIIIGPHDDAIDSISENTLDILKKNMIWCGFRSDIKELLSISNIFVLPQLYREGFPRVLLEAGSMGVPIITSDVPGCRELIKNGVNGILVKPGDEDELFNSIISLIKNEDKRNFFAKEIRKDVVSKYDLSIIFDQYVKLYESFKPNVQ